ncbi:cytidylate kinase-like family protein, partial [Bacteroidales bacterium OttesenSCG-928-I21]|nr:cytidylate kinase-like family protein [Bacteroidales bacterium OttesenSCG-928-I21]
MNEKFVITIGRQLGSGGIVVGKKIAEKLNIAFYDKNLLKVASKESGLEKEFFEKTDEKKKFNFFAGFLGFQVSPHIDEWYSSSLLNDENLFKVQSDVIRSIAENQSCVFVGRCADYVLRDNPRCVNVFLTGNESDRIDFIAKQENLSAEKAKELIEKTNKKRANYYNYYSNKVWGRADSYHLCLNTSSLGIDASVDFIIDYVAK